MQRPSVAALGGGHGLAASLSALRHVTNRITAVVTVADDGGSSGRLRAQYPMVPPGDLRMALLALHGDNHDEEILAEALAHRFGGEGELSGHAAGNLLLASLFAVTRSPAEALGVAGRLLGLPDTARVLPAANEPLDLVGVLQTRRGGSPVTVTGQCAVGATDDDILDVRLSPEHPEACHEAEQAIRDADWVFLGPGSWYSSVVPHLLVPGIRSALAETDARRCVTLNLKPQSGETTGYSPCQHLETLARYAPELRLDYVFADTGVPDLDDLVEITRELGGEVVTADVAAGPSTHDPLRLAAAYAAVMLG